MERAYIIEDWPGPWEKWAYNYGSRNLWRVSHVIGNDMEDFMQEAAHTYVTTRLRYGSKINSPQHFMRLYQMSLSCWVTDLSIRDSRGRNVLTHLSDKEPSVAPEADLSLLLDSGSKELKEVLEIMLYAPKEVMDVLRAEASSYSTKQFWNRVLAYCKIPPDHSKPLMQELHDLLT